MAALIPSVITSIFSSTLGLLWNKTRDSIVAKLKDGGITDEKIREALVRELDDIKTKLDSISRAALHSSYSFFTEGVALLLDSFQTLERRSNESEGATSHMASDMQYRVLTQALELPRVIGKLKISSKSSFESAKKRFRDARRRATDAFNNESLSIKDRIFAAKLRVVAEILEHLENPDTAVTGCLSFLTQLHSLPAVRQIFSVYLRGGFKARFNKAERLENVKSVMMINYVICELNSMFTHKLRNRFSWPGSNIDLIDGSFNPILDWKEITKRKLILWDEAPVLPKKCLREAIDLEFIALKSQGDIVCFTRSSRCENYVIVVSRSGDMNKIATANQFYDNENVIAAVAVDNYNNTYVLIRSWETEEIPNFRLSYMYVLDENYKYLDEIMPSFWNDSSISYRDEFKIAFSRNNDLIMINSKSPDIYICDGEGNLKHKFKQDSSPLCGVQSLSISDKNEIITSFDAKKIFIFAEEGNLKSTIAAPEGHSIYGAAFHYLIRKIIVLSRQDDSFFLHYYSNTGEQETSTLIFEKDKWDDTIFSRGFGGEIRIRSNRWRSPRIISHPGGLVAVVRCKSITFI